MLKDDGRDVFRERHRIGRARRRRKDASDGQSEDNPDGVHGMNLRPYDTALVPGLIA